MECRMLISLIPAFLGIRVSTTFYQYTYDDNESNNDSFTSIYIILQFLIQK